MENNKCLSGCEKLEPLCTVSENIGATVKNSSVDPTKLNIELPYYPVIPLLDMYAKLFHNSIIHNS